MTLNEAHPLKEIATPAACNDRAIITVIAKERSDCGNLPGGYRGIERSHPLKEIATPAARNDRVITTVIAKERSDCGNLHGKP